MPSAQEIIARLHALILASAGGDSYAIFLLIPMVVLIWDGANTRRPDAAAVWRFLAAALLIYSATAASANGCQGTAGLLGLTAAALFFSIVARSGLRVREAKSRWKWNPPLLVAVLVGWPMMGACLGR